jgi:hypothetical protein
MTVPQQPRLLEEVDAGDAGRRELDAYFTPAWMTRALLRRVQLPPGCHVLEPAAGELAIARVLRQAGCFVVTNDLDTTRPTNLHCDATDAAFWKRLPLKPELVAGNPPFGVAFAIVEHAVATATFGVAMLLRITWLEPTEDKAARGVVTVRGRGEWLAAHPPTRMVVLPRWSFRGTGSDSAICVWCLWAIDPSFCAPGIEIVSKREMRELIALEKERG